MSLLDDQLRGRLPPRHSQEGEENPTVYARFYLPITSIAWYLIEGQPEGEDFLLYGFVAGPNVFREFRLSDLEKIVIRVERDPKFTEVRFNDVVPTPNE